MEGWRGWGERMRGREESNRNLRSWPEQLTGCQCHMMEQEGLGEVHCEG